MTRLAIWRVSKWNTADFGISFLIETTLCRIQSQTYQQTFLHL
jgi:hypothetical protein